MPLIDPRLEQDSVFVTDMPLCQVRLMNQAALPWLVLIPRGTQAIEAHHLPADDQTRLWQEAAWAARAVERLFAPVKINIGALGNIVRQLHVHIVGRFETDPAWPGPVWGALPPAPYVADALADRVTLLQKEFRHADR